MKDQIVNKPHFNFSVDDVITILFLYNVVFFATWLVLNDSFKVCFFVALFGSLVTLFLILLEDLLIKKNEEELKLYEKNIRVRELLRSEYKEVHKLKKREDILKKAGCTNSLMTDFCLAEDDYTNANYLNNASKVYLDYIKSSPLFSKDSNSNKDNNPKGNNFL